MYRTFDKSHPIFVAVFIITVFLGFTAVTIFWQAQPTQSISDLVKLNTPNSKERSESGWNSSLINNNLPVFPINSKIQIDSKYQNSKEIDQQSSDQEKQRLQSEYMQMPVRFEPNQGQVDSSKVKFTAHGGGYSLFLTDTGATFVLRQMNQADKTESAESGDQAKRVKIGKIASIEMKLLEANNLGKTAATEEMNAKSNYFIGSDQSKWRTDVPNYGRVRFQEVYEGIDLEYYGNQNEIEYDFIVKAGAEPEKIKLRFAGIEKVSVNSQGELILKTEIGEVRQKKPIIYQEENGERQEIAGGYKVEGQEVSFWLGQYDKQKSLIIDPILYAAAFIGGSDFDSVQDVSSINYSYTSNSTDYRLKGYALTGITSSLNFPTTAGVLQGVYGGGTDIFVRTFSQKFQSGILIESASYTTYLGGSGYDAGYGAAMDTDRNVWITGETASANFPTTSNGAQRTYGGGVGDAYIVQINAQGNALLYSTYHGSSSYDYGFDIGIQNNLNFNTPVTTAVWLTGGTSSTNFPTISSSAAQQTYGGGTQDGFVTRILLGNLSRAISPNSGTLGAIPDSTGGPQVPGSPRDVTFTVSGVSGTISNVEVGMSLTHSYVGDLKAVLIAPDGTTHNIFGYTGAISATPYGDDSNLGGYYSFYDGATSPPSGGWWQEATARTATQALTEGSYRTTNSGGAGATNPMPPTSISSAFSGIANANGTWTLRITDGAAQDTGSITDAYLAFDSSRNVSSTFLGGSGTDVGKALYIENYNFGNYVWITGSTASTNFPTTTGAFQRIYGGGASDAFISRYGLFNNGPNILSNSTYLGGTGTDSGNGIFSGTVVGNTSSTNFPTTTGAFQQIYGGGASDAFYSVINYDFQSIYASTFLGGSGDDIANDVSKTNVGNDEFITGSTTSTNFPTTPDAVQSVKSGGKDAFISKLFFGALRYSTYYGGSSDDSGNGIAGGIADVSEDNVLIVGDTSSTNFPTTQGGGQTIYGGGTSDGFFITTTKPLLLIQVYESGGCFNPSCSSLVRPSRIYARRNSDSQEFNAINGVINVPAGDSYFVTAEGGTLFDGRNVNWSGYSLTNVTTPQSLYFYVQTPTHNVSGVLTGLTSIAGVTVSVTGGNISGSRSASVNLNAQNQVVYSITNLSCSYQYTITPLRNGTTFSSPSNGQTPYIFQDETLSFTATTANPVPAVSSISPTSAAAGGTAFTLTVNGTNFVNGSIVRWNGQDRTTVYVSATQLTAQIPATDIQTAGTNQVSVFNPAPGGGTSPTSITFTVNNPTPVITTISPTSLTVGSTSGFQLTVNGSNFVNGSIVRWNGQDRVTTFVSAVQVKAQIIASDLQTAGVIPVTVFNPTPGGGTSNVANFTLNNPVPFISSLNPASQPAGSSAFELTVNGTGLVNGSIVRWNGQNRTTTFVSPTQIKAQITSTDLQTAGQFPITVFNLTPAGGTSNISNFTVANTIVRRALYDFDGDNKTDIAIFRPAVGEWWINRSSTSQTVAARFGTSTDKIVPGDYTSDGKTDIAFFRPSTGEWFVLRSQDSSFFLFPFGTTGDIPVVGDFDGDGTSDAGVFRPSTNEWFIRKSSGGTLITTFGASGDVPMAADYDGDGKSDIAIYRSSNGQWWIQRSSNLSVVVAAFGTSSDKPIPADFTGDGKADIAFWRNASREWFILRSEDSSFYSFPFGSPGDTPVPGDYDTDGKADPAVFNNTTRTWWINRTSAGILIQDFGSPGDIPVPSAFTR